MPAEQTQQKLSAELLPKLGECKTFSRSRRYYTRVTFCVTCVTEEAHVQRENVSKEIRKVIIILIYCEEKK